MPISERLTEDTLSNNVIASPRIFLISPSTSTTASNAFSSFSTFWITSNARRNHSLPSSFLPCSLLFSPSLGGEAVVRSRIAAKKRSRQTFVDAVERGGFGADTASEEAFDGLLDLTMKRPWMSRKSRTSDTLSSDLGTLAFRTSEESCSMAHLRLSPRDFASALNLSACHSGLRT